MFPRRTSRPTPTSACPRRHSLIRQRIRSERARCDSPSLCYPTARLPFTQPTLPSCGTSFPRRPPPRATSKHTPFLMFRDQESTLPRSSQAQTSMSRNPVRIHRHQRSQRSHPSHRNVVVPRRSPFSSLKLGPTVKHQGQVDLDLERKVRTPLCLPSLSCPLSHISVGTTVTFTATTLNLAHLREVGCRAFASD
jgi:hypothetical protein